MLPTYHIPPEFSGFPRFHSIGHYVQKRWMNDEWSAMVSIDRYANEGSIRSGCDKNIRMAAICLNSTIPLRLASMKRVEKKTKLSYLSCWRAITYMYIYVYITCSHPHKFIYVYNMCKSHVYIYINITCVMYYSNINNMYIEIYLTCTWYHVKIRFVDQNSRPKKIAVSCINWHWLIGDRLCWDTCLVPSRIPSMECLR